jgi:23S rRNA pseudouridine2605 synthase
MVLHQGLNRQIRRMCRDVDFTVLRLMRVAEGPVDLGDLEPGRVRPLSSSEVSALRRAVGLEG